MIDKNPTKYLYLISRDGKVVIKIHEMYLFCFLVILIGGSTLIAMRIVIYFIQKNRKNR